MTYKEIVKEWLKGCSNADNGKPVQMTNCDHCNKKGDLDVGAGVSEYAPCVEYIGAENE